ncbi:cilia- and flagella-associated protein 46 isoform X2 [Denticeps clupeoides]|uniref:cilia- and flagella-associated protein 46 isoform X2 n=1 Tax=Denticeps clupeoides TaxID=299321 RepID=UPI0010A49D92|nr:cilia- and flagella-associated protein 46 isoform X2 [Denticeps clupeoides]
MDIRVRRNLAKARDRRDTEALKAAFHILKDAGNTKPDSTCFGVELYVLCAEQAVELGCAEIAEDCLKMFFDGKPPVSQYLCRAHLCSGRLNQPQNVQSEEDVEKAMACFMKVIEISKQEQRYHYLVFNASVLYFQSVRRLQRPGQRRHLVSTLSQVVQALEDVGDQDYGWRAQLMMLLTECFVEAGRQDEARNFARLGSDFIQTHQPDLLPYMFSLRVQHNLISTSEGKALMKGNPVLMAICEIQKLKQSLRLSGVRKEDQEKLTDVCALLALNKSAESSFMSSGPRLIEQTPVISPAYRIELLLELAFVSVQLKEPETASECLRELKSAETLTVRHKVMMECVQCGVDLLKHAGKIEEYSKASVQAWLQVVGRLEDALQVAVREGDGGLVQAVCASLWNSCLPLLQHNLRRRVKSALLKLSRVLEDVDSTLQDMRCQVHAELALLAEDEEHLEEATQHLQKALQMDEHGLHRGRLQPSLHRLQLFANIYTMPEKREDQAAMLIQKARSPSVHGELKKQSPMLVSAGEALAPDAFQMVVKADRGVPAGSGGEGLVAQLALKAKYHMDCMKKVDDHLTGLGSGTNDRERVRLWASLAKTARKQEVWDVCRAASRFCLLYDDGRWKLPSDTGEQKSIPVVESNPDGWPACEERDLLKLLAEIRFINAEATIQKLRYEGVELNALPMSPKQTESMTEDLALWDVYRIWIQEMSAYATDNFLRGAELGAELSEAWLVVNAAVYLWNYNSHLLATGGQRHLLPMLSKLVDLLRQTGHAGENAMLALLCDTVVEGLIQPWCVVDGGTPAHIPEGTGGGGTQSQKKGGGKGPEKTGNISTITLDPAALQDVRKALELSEFALRLPSGSENVPIVVRKRLIRNWVRIKQLLQQQIGPKLDAGSESDNGVITAMTRVLVAVEMMICNTHPFMMEFTVPSLTVLVQMALECRWTDPVVELYVWAHFAHFAYQSHHHDLVLTCTQSALQLESRAIERAKASCCALYPVEAVQEMLSSAACLKGLSLLQRTSGHLPSYRTALDLLLDSVRHAVKAGAGTLCMASARNFWNACLPLLGTAAERQKLKEPLELILHAITSTSGKPAKEKDKKETGPCKIASDPMTSLSEDDLAVKVAMYSLLFHIHADQKDWKAALQMLERGIRETPSCKHKRLLYEQCVQVKAWLGDSTQMDMQRFKHEGEAQCAHMWHSAALSSRQVEQKLAFYQNAITSLQSPPGQWQKVEYLLEFGAWLYCQQFPLSCAKQQVHCAIDLLLLMKGMTGDSIDEGDAEPQKSGEGGRPESTAAEEALKEVEQGQSGAHHDSLDEMMEVRRLDSLMRAHTLLALMTDRVSPEYQQQLLLANTFLLRIWQVSIATVQDFVREMKSPLVPRSHLVQSAMSKEKDKEKEKLKRPKDSPTVPEKCRQKNPEGVWLPSTPEEWARYKCSEDVRQEFRTSASPRCINQESVARQNHSMFFLKLLADELCSISLHHLALPALHLAEVIAHDLSNNKGLADLYRLRIVQCCRELGLQDSAGYQENIYSLVSIREEELTGCRKAITLQKARSTLQVEAANDKSCKKPVAEQDGLVAWHSVEPSAQDVWLDKAELCISMGLYQPARKLLANAHLVAKELGDPTSLTKCLHLLAVLANKEQNPTFSLALLEQAQDMRGDEYIWCKITLTLLTAIEAQGGEDAPDQASQIIEKACAVLRSALEQRRNRTPFLHFLIALLETKGASVNLHLLETMSPGVDLSERSQQRLLGCCDVLRHSGTELLLLGRRKEAVQSLKQQAETLRILAAHTDSAEMKHHHMLEAFSLLQQAVSVQEEVVWNAQSLLPAECVRVSLPCVRSLQRCRLCLADQALLMLELQCEEQKSQELERQRRTVAERSLLEYIQSNAELSSVEQQWLSVGKTLGQVALDQLTATHSLSMDCVETRASSLGMMGRCLRLLAVKKDPLHVSSIWETPHMEDSGPEKGAPPADEDLSSGAVEQRMCAAKSAKPLKGRHGPHLLLAQATEMLAQAIGLSLLHGLLQPLQQACVSMLECFGSHQPAASGQYLALLQSCQCCSLLSDLLTSSCSDTSRSQAAALLNLRRNLLATEDWCRPADKLQLRETEECLSGLSKMYCQLNINPKHLSILGDLPTNIKILLLQHTPDRSVLYGGFYERSKASADQKAKNLQATGALECSKVAKALVNPKALQKLVERARAFRLHMQANADRSTHVSAFRALVDEMEEYLQPILSQLDFSSFRPEPLPISICDAARSRDKEKKLAADKGQPGSPVAQGESVILLVDQEMMMLPLEALAVLQEPLVLSVSRDFSMQLFHSRLQQQETVESDNKRESKGARGAKGKGDQSKTIKVVPVNRVLPPGSIPVDAYSFKYIIVPDTDDCHSETLKKSLEILSQQFTPPLEGLIGSQSIPSLADLKQQLTNCSAFIFYNTERFLAWIPPAKLAVLNMADCKMAILFDLVQNNSQRDIHKSASKLFLEPDLETVLLLSAVGVSSIMMNQWCSTTQANAHNLCTVMEGLMKMGLTSGQTVHSLHLKGPQSSKTDGSVLNVRDTVKKDSPSPSALNFIIYGLPNVVIT